MQMSPDYIEWAVTSTLGWPILYNSAALPEVSRPAQPLNKQTTRLCFIKSAEPLSISCAKVFTASHAPLV